jgi:gliding motility-associated lipoprotein GldH
VKSIWIVCLLTCIALLTSCGKDAYYSKSYQFENESWSQKVKPKFVVDFQDTTKLYDFIIALRTSTDYKFNNLWIFLNSKPPSGAASREPYEIKTTYPDGSWIGKKSGSIVEHQLIFKRRKPPYKGKYVFEIEQGISQKVIDEVLDISFIVEETK